MLLFAKIVALIGLILGSAEDIRTREVPDWLNFGLIFIGVGSALIFSLVESDYSYIVNSIAGLIVCITLAYLMFYTAQWGGGDSKLLMGLGALIGLDVYNLQQVPLLLTLVLNIFIFGAIFGLIWTLVLAIKHWKSFVKRLKAMLYSPKIVMLRKINLAVSFLLLITIMFVPFVYKLIFFALMLFLYVSLYLWMFVKSIEESCMIKDVDVSKLTEGDWIVKPVIVKGKKICGPKDLGIKKHQIAELKALKAKGLIKKVTIKEGMPFVPSFLIGFIVTWIWGNWFLLLF
ncbi:prepilin peptidase [Nanoarchaeota archaeon]